jgi:hypothetical protein
MPIREDTDFSAYQADSGDRHSGWNWYCMRCTEARGHRWARTDARRDARSHVAKCSHDGGDRG